MINGSDEIFDDVISPDKIINNQYDNIIDKFIDYINKAYEQFEKFNFDDKILEKSKKIMCICYGDA